MSSDYIAGQAFDELVGRNSLANYQFGDKMVNHYFCSRCGVYPFHDSTVRPGDYRVNLGCVAGLDLQGLTVHMLDGLSF